MAQPEFIEPAPELRSASYAQAVRLGNRIETSGQGGWTRSRAIPPRVADEVAQAFDNIANVLAPAGASWADVVSVTAYHVRSEEDVVAATAAELRRRAGAAFPTWTSVGVPMLGPGMHIEIKVTAIVGGEYELMERPEFFAAPGHGSGQPDPLHRSQLVKVGNRIETAVHGGWTDRGDIPSDRDEEIAQTFANLERTLNTAGSSWSDVIGVDSYHLELNLDVFEFISTLLRERIPTHAPIWTCVGTTGLADPRMRIGIRVTAVARS